MFCHSGLDDYHLVPYVFRSTQGFPGDLMRSLGKDATLGNVLWVLDEHYGIMMTFDALSEELYSLRQGTGEYVAEFRVHLSQQVQILQMEYPSRIQQEHVEEIKWDHFYKNLSPKHWWMLPISSIGETLSPIPSCSLPPANWKGKQKPETLHSQKPYCQEFEHNSFSITRKSISLQEVEG